MREVKRKHAQSDLKYNTYPPRRNLELAPVAADLDLVVIRVWQSCSGFLSSFSLFGRLTDSNHEKRLDFDR